MRSDRRTPARESWRSSRRRDHWRCVVIAWSFQSFHHRGAESNVRPLRYLQSSVQGSRIPVNQPIGMWASSSKERQKTPMGNAIDLELYAARIERARAEMKND